MYLKVKPATERRLESVTLIWRRSVRSKTKVLRMTASRISGLMYMSVRAM